MAIYFFETNESEQKYLLEGLPGETLKFCSEPITTAEQARKIAEDAEVVSPFVQSRLSADVIESMPSLKMIAARSTAIDHINAPAAASRGIVLCNVPAYGENTVAEHTFALILALSRNLHKAYLRTTAGNFAMDGLQGFDLKGKTLGVVGVGGVGEYVMRIAKGFGMHLLAYDPVQDMKKADHFDFTYTSLENLMENSDIVTLHASGDSKTRHLIGAHNIGHFKRGALLINTARGEMVDTEALLSALDQGILRGAGLDVLEGEDVLSEEKQLLRNPNASEITLKQALRNRSLLQRSDLVVTPHIAYDSAEAIERILETTIQNIKAYRRGWPQNQAHA